jgi:hypothetical protein
MRPVVLSLALITTAVVASAGGYWLGFRHAWQRSLMADAPIRGAIAIHHLRMLDKGPADNLRILFESDIDSGLQWWAHLEEYPLFGVINELSGQDVVPGVQRYVRRIATYRKDHDSPLSDPARIERMLENARQNDPALAKDLEQGGREADENIKNMIEKYAE